MFKRHRTDPQREFASVASSFHDRLIGSAVTARPDAARVNAHSLRGRLGGQSEIGLRDRIDRGLRTA
jgi:hypothetical protein